MRDETNNCRTPEKKPKSSTAAGEGKACGKPEEGLPSPFSRRSHLLPAECGQGSGTELKGWSLTRGSPGDWSRPWVPCWKVGRSSPCSRPYSQLVQEELRAELIRDTDLSCCLVRVRCIPCPLKRMGHLQLGAGPQGHQQSSVLRAGLEAKWELRRQEGSSAIAGVTFRVDKRLGWGHRQEHQRGMNHLPVPVPGSYPDTVAKGSSCLAGLARVEPTSGKFLSSSVLVLLLRAQWLAPNHSACLARHWSVKQIKVFFLYFQCKMFYQLPDRIGFLVCALPVYFTLKTGVHGCEELLLTTVEPAKQRPKASPCVPRYMQVTKPVSLNVQSTAKWFCQKWVSRVHLTPWGSSTRKGSTIHILMGTGEENNLRASVLRDKHILFSWQSRTHIP